MLTPSTQDQAGEECSDWAVEAGDQLSFPLSLLVVLGPWGPPAQSWEPLVCGYGL